MRRSRAVDERWRYARRSARGRWRLQVQLVLVESAMLALIASMAGALFAWWSAPFVVSRINPPDNPARLMLPADWRVFAFGLLLTLGRDGSVRAGTAADCGPFHHLAPVHSRRRSMQVLIAEFNQGILFCRDLCLLGRAVSRDVRSIGESAAGIFDGSGADVEYRGSRRGAASGSGSVLGTDRRASANGARSGKGRVVLADMGVDGRVGVQICAGVRGRCAAGAWRKLSERVAGMVRHHEDPAARRPRFPGRRHLYECVAKQRGDCEPGFRAAIFPRRRSERKNVRHRGTPGHGRFAFRNCRPGRRCAALERYS